MRSSLATDVRGAALTEFGLLLPVLAMLLLGSLDMGHRAYARVVLDGALQKAARDSALEGGNAPAKQAQVDARLLDTARDLHNGATVTTTRLSYRTFADAARRHEPYTDTNGNGQCDNGEPFTDVIVNNSFDADIGRAGQGGAQDVVVFTSTMTYPAIMPVRGLLGLSDTVSITATAVVRNQPYNDQGANGTAGTGNCT
ncbi:TadE/TadG family type IV pilus assembly protein [Sphingomonas lenta]|uniref:TadE-like domain-containing protein n=1 Tax=Sphingomonas lenta TaxID=1141887 RepID=A0A2A2SGY7_9SPHN|nr:TadE/TadG family type IV pilus assembly protein [Sphingomonas lenta]PAX08473.1 hypothetical protein CKY28_03535 [Sphingomonas lenta]